MGRPLPPFGIRDLQENEPFSILQVNEQQYQTTIESNPEAILSYIDEDDGENIIVGSGFELRQRLEDNPSSTAPARLCYDQAKNDLEHRLVHLFDIRRTNTSRTAWEEHLATYQQNRARFDELLGLVESKRDSVSSFALDSDRSDREDGALEKDVFSLQSQSNCKTGAVNLSAALSEVVPDLIENLANVMQTTSETLRKAAAKSRDTNTSPIEDLLSGVSNIVTEIGSFGLSLLDQISEKNANTTSEDDSTSPNPLQKSPVSDMSSPLSSKGDTQEHASVSNIDTVSPPVRTSSPKAYNVARDLTTEPCFCVRCSNCKLGFRNDSESNLACHNCVALNCPCPLILDSDRPPPATDLDHSDDSMLGKSPTDDSILDQDTEDADFSRRYPPLMSLRRATTIAGLHDRFNPSIFTGLGQEGLGLSRHNSWTRRFPHRPLPQVLDAETQRRRDFARNCFPTQLYTPGPGPQSDQSPPSLKSFKQSVGLQSHGPQVDVNAIESPRTVPDRSFDSKKSLPGAWPEFLESRSATDAPPGESSGAFFHRMMRDNPSRKQDHASESSERLQRHRSFSKQRSSNNPFTDLNRSHTVSTATNPASRLNRPFDPFYPVASVEKLSTQQTAASPKPRPEWPFNGTSQPPSKLNEKASGAPRPFSPVWEDNLDQSKPHSTSQKDVSSALDRHGESSSMYSPPPRHMRSVPNFATKTAITTTDSTDRVALVSSYTAPRSSVPARTRYSPFSSIASDSSPTAEKTSKTPLHVTFEPKEDTSAKLSNERPAISPEAPTFVFPPPKPKAKKNRRSSDPIQKCVRTLQRMGFGQDDENLKSRLHMYATVADGNVTEAVDLIEEDKRAHFANTVVDAHLEWQ